MDQLIKDIEAFANARSIKPATVLQRFGYSGTAWAKWKRGGVTCTMSMAEKIRAHIGESIPNHRNGNANTSKQNQGPDTKFVSTSDAA